MTTDIAVRPNGSVATVREEFGATELQTQMETAATAIAAREQAAIQAQYVMAMRRPRNIEQVRIRMLAECDRTGFAEVARYRKPVGRRKNEQTGEWEQSYAEGFSIRFAEMALRHMGNIKCDALPLFDSDDQRIVMMAVIDLESNSIISKPTTISKRVERSSLKKGQAAISERLNSKGEKTYLVAATDDEINMKESALWSKFMRNLLRFVPGDILDECERRIHTTLRADAAKDPEAAKRKMIDAFVSIGVQPIDLEAYLGHTLNRPLQPAEREDLLGLYAAIKDGETTWQAVMESKDKTGSEDLQKEVLAKKLAEAEAAKQGNPPASASGDSTANSGGGHAADNGTPGESGSAPTQPAPEKPTFGRRPR